MSNIVKWTSRALDWMSRPRAATVETLGHPAAGVIGWLGGNASASGIAVTEENAYDYSPVFAATRLLSSGAGNLPCRLMLGGRDKQQRKGGRKVAVEHPVHKLVYDAPNPLMTSSRFRGSGVVQQVNAGNAYAEIERDGMGRPVAMWPIHQSRVRVVREGPNLTYLVYSEGRVDALAKEEVLHVPSPICIDGISGMGVIAHARETIGAGMQAEKHAGYTFANGAVPRTVLSHPKNMSKEARSNLREEWQQLYGGTDNAGKTAVLWEGMTLTPLSINNDDAQFLETRGFNVTEIARWYGVPPHMIGDMSGSTNNNIEHQGRSFIQLSLMPIIIPWEEEFDRKLLTEEERAEGYYIYFDVNEWQRGDAQARAMSNQVNFMNGFINADEVRESEDKDPLPNGWGQKFYIPANLMEVGKEPEPIEPVVEDAEEEPEMPVSEGAAKPVEGGALAYSDDQPRDESGRFGEGGGGGSDDSSPADRANRNQHERVTKGDIAEGLKAIRNDPNHARLSQELASKRDEVARSIKDLAENSGESRQEQKATAEKVKEVLANHAKGVGEHLRSTLKVDELSQDTGIAKEKLEGRLEKVISRIEKTHAAELKTWAKEQSVHQKSSYDVKVPEIGVVSVIESTGLSGEKADKLGLAIAKRAGLSASESDFLTYKYRSGESSDDYARRIRDGKGLDGPEGSAARNAAKACFSHEFSRMVRVEQNAARSAAKKSGKWFPWLDEFYGRHEQAMVAALEHAGNVLIALGQPCDVPAICKAHCKESYDLLLAASDAKPDQFEAAVETLVAGWAERANIHKEVAHV